MKDPWRYRNKVQMPVGAKADGELITGFYQKRSHRIIEGMETCNIQDEETIVWWKRCAGLQTGLVLLHTMKNDRGVLRHIMVRTGEQTNDAMIVLVTRTQELPYKDELVRELTETYPHIKSIVHNVNDQQTNVILGKKTEIIWGDEYIYDK